MMKYEDALDTVLNLREVTDFYYWGHEDGYLYVNFDREFSFNAMSDGTDEDTWDDVKRCLCRQLGRLRKKCKKAEFVLKVMLEFEEEGLN